MEDWEKVHYDYPYYTGDFGPIAPIIESSGIALNLGFALKWSYFAVETLYQIDFFNIELIDTTTLNEKMHSIELHLSVDLDFLPKASGGPVK